MLLSWIKRFEIATMAYKGTLRRIKRLSSVGVFLSFLAIFTFLQLKTQYQISNAQDYYVIPHNNRGHSLSDRYAQETFAHCSTERRDFVYVKMIKCASETLASMFRRFGYHRNLSFVLPVGRRIYVGWPYQIQNDMYRHTDTNTFNILTDHAIYNKTTMKSLMKPGDIKFVLTFIIN